MRTQGRCLLCGETKLDTGKPKLRKWFIEHIRVKHTHVVLVDDVLQFDQNYWKQYVRETENEPHT